MPQRDYVFNGLAGCVTQRTSRCTGLLVGLYQADQAGLDPAGGRWVTVCEPHATLCQHTSLALARHHLGDPLGWCEPCAQAMAQDAALAAATSKEAAPC